MSVPYPLVDRLVVGFDVEKYSPRNIRRQKETQADLDRILDDAALAAGLDRRLWDCQAGGDGELAVLPEGVDLASVAGCFISELDETLRIHNEDRVPEMWIRLRVAMHIDVLTRSALGHAGPALIVLSRLLDDPLLRAALQDAPGAPLALLVSGSFYHKVITSGLRGLHPEEFRQVCIDNPAKAFRMTAFLRIPRVAAVAPGEEQHCEPGSPAGHEDGEPGQKTAGPGSRPPEPGHAMAGNRDRDGPPAAGVVIHGGVHNQHGDIIGHDRISMGGPAPGGSHDQQPG